MFISKSKLNAIEYQLNAQNEYINSLYGQVDGLRSRLHDANENIKILTDKVKKLDEILGEIANGKEQEITGNSLFMR